MSEENQENPLIKYLIIGDLDSSKYITEFSATTLDSKVKKDSNHIYAKICKTQERHFDERNKISAKENNYYFTLSAPNICFLVYAAENCPERVVFAMIEEIKNENVLTMINEGTGELNPTGRQKLKEIVDKYQTQDKIAAIQEDVNAIKVDMKKNIEKMVDSVEDTEKLENKAEELKNASKDYKDNSQEVRKITWWQNFKLTIIIVLVVLLILGIVAWLIFK